MIRTMTGRSNCSRRDSSITRSELRHLRSSYNQFLMGVI